jgi:lycopene beta-cyclase
MEQVKNEQSADVVILGGGMSGLALACQIANYNEQHPDESKTAVVVEPRSNYQRDKTWCFWQHQPTPFDRAITHQWHRWQVCANGRTHTSEYSQVPYVRVDSGHYYNIAQQQLAKSESVSLITGNSASKILVCDKRIGVQCEALKITAEFAYDTRPKNIPGNTLLQHFVGWEITTDHDVFDPNIVTLMDFQVTQADDIHFFYILPFDKRHALVETTHFSKTLLTEDAYAEELSDYLSGSLGLASWHIQNQEQGVIPMPQKSASLTRREHFNVVPFGLHSDTPRPSTGYCYPHAQSQALEHVLNLFANRPPKASRNFFVRWLDQIFISFLEHHPEQAASTFFTLFEQVPTQVLIRFLGDNAKPFDYLKVIMAMPKIPFVREAVRSVSNP